MCLGSAVRCLVTRQARQPMWQLDDQAAAFTHPGLIPGGYGLPPIIADRVRRQALFGYSNETPEQSE